MRTLLIGLAALTLGLASTADAGQESGNLKGTYGFFDSCGPDGKSKNCVMTFEVKGDAAKALYSRMPVKAVPEPCTNGLLKDDGHGLRCYKANGEFRCDFGYSFGKRKFTGSDVSC